MYTWQRDLSPTIVQYQWYLGHLWGLDLYIVHHQDFGRRRPQGTRTGASELVQGGELVARAHIAVLHQGVSWMSRRMEFKEPTKGIGSNPLLASL